MIARRGPVLIEHDDSGVVVLDFEDVEPVPDIGNAPPNGSAMLTVGAILTRPVSWFRRLFWASLVGLISIIASVAAWDFATGLLARNVVLARITAGLLAVIGLALLIAILRETIAFARLRRIDSLQIETRKARLENNRTLAGLLVKRLDGLYSSREETRWGRDVLAQRGAEVLDGDGLLNLAETSLLAPLDAQARKQIEVASRQVAAVTAIVPLAFADVAVALTTNVRMVRQIAEIYGGRAGFFGSMRLLRAVASHLIATGAVAVADDMLGSIAGGGVLAKISRRFGEGVINGALTARVGIAALEVCRPMPFHALKRPGVSGITGSALKGLFGRPK